jgi:PAS domain S-box-containing protein
MFLANMNDESKSREELIEELASLRRRVADYEILEYERKVEAETVRENEDILRHQNRVLIELAKSRKLDSEDLIQALKEITEASARTLDVERTSVWLYNEDRSKIHCIDLFEKGQGQHTAGFDLAAANYPSYFKALEEERTIAAQDAHTDPRTREFSESYLIPLDIRSMLDAPVWLYGEMAGVICNEHVGSTRHWTQDEKNFAGSIADLVALAMETHERILLEQQLRCREQELADFFENAPLGLHWVGPEGYILWANQAEFDMLGYSREEYIGHHITEFFADKQFVEDFLKRLLSGETIHNQEARLVCKDGYIKTVLISCNVLWEEGKFIHTRCYTRDISDRKRFETQLRELTETALALNLTLSLEESRSINAVLETVTKWARAIIGAHQCAVSLAQFNEREQAVTVLSLSDKYSAHHSEWKEFFENFGDSNTHSSICLADNPIHMTQDELEAHPWWIKFTNRTGMQFFLRGCLAAPFMGRDGRNRGLIILSDRYEGEFNSQDETFLIQLAQMASVALENLRLYKEAEEARKDAELANRVKDEFLAIVTHELKTPLTAMLGWARLLHTSNMDESLVARAVETIERNAKTQAQLIDDLLDTSRIISGKLHLDLQPTELIPILQSSVDTVRPLAEAKGINLELSLDPWTGPVSGDPTRLQQIAWNLLSNAIKFTPNGGRIDVKLERIGFDLHITVSDTGAGINADFLPYVFDRFRQASVNITRRQGGLGLGLAIVRHLVELHGGIVEAESPGENQGSTFRVILPVDRVWIVNSGLQINSSPSSYSKSIILDSQSGILDGIKILVVEDEPDTRHLLMAILEKYGASIRDASTVSEALREVEHSMPDVVVSDIGMPGEDGYTLIEKIRALRPEKGGRIPAVALTAFTRAEERDRALSAGFQVHMSKPIEPDELVNSIAGLVNRLRAAG